MFHLPSQTPNLPIEPKNTMWVSTSRNHTRTQEVSQVLQKTMSLKILHGPAAHQTHSRWANEMQRIHGKYKQNDVKHMVHFLLGNEVWLIKINQIEDCEWTEHIPETHNPLKNTTQTRYIEVDIMRQHWWNPCVYQQKVMLHKRSFAIFLRKCTVNPATDYNIFSGRTWTNLWRDLKLLNAIS